MSRYSPLPTFFECPLSGAVIRSQDICGVGFKPSDDSYLVGYSLHNGEFLAVYEAYGDYEAHDKMAIIRDKMKELLTQTEEEDDE